MMGVLGVLGCHSNNTQVNQYPTPGYSLTMHPQSMCSSTLNWFPTSNQVHIASAFYVQPGQCTEIKLQISKGMVWFGFFQMALPTYFLFTILINSMTLSMTPPPVVLWSIRDPSIIDILQNWNKGCSILTWPKHPGHHLLQLSVILRISTEIVMFSRHTKPGNFSKSLVALAPEHSIIFSSGTYCLVVISLSLT